MDRNKKRAVSFLVVFVILIICCIGVVVAFLSINQATVKRFGKPSSRLSITQRLIFPLELFFNRQLLVEPLDAQAESQSFYIDQGESVGMICLRLEQEMFIEDAEIFRIYLIYTDLDRQLKAGNFELSAAMSPVEIAVRLLDATPTEATVTILPGWRIEEVALNIAGSGLAISQEMFMVQAYSPDPTYLALLPVSTAPTLEGFLLPGTYVVPRETDAAAFITLVLMGFNDQIDQAVLDGFTRQGLTVYEAVTLASIIEREAILDDEKPMIASVFLNRLRTGMRLETDPTVQYALGWQEDLNTWWKAPLSAADLSIESPYNTYIIYGFPPTPICNPDLSSLQAVAFPAETPYYYFRAACDGSGRHNFAITYQEHLENGCE